MPLDWVKQRSLVKTVMNLRVPDWASNFLTSRETAAQKVFCCLELVNCSGFQCDESQTDFKHFLKKKKDLKFQKDRQFDVH